MSGTTIPVIGMTPFDFKNLAGGSVAAEVVVAQNIDVTAYSAATLLVRVHAIDITYLSAAQIEIFVKSVLPSPQDPARTFATSSNLAAITLTANSQTWNAMEGTVQVEALTAPIGAFLSITVQGKTSTNPAADLSATISIELSLKSE